MKKNGKTLLKTILLIIPIAFTLPLALASYCSLNFNPKLMYYQNNTLNFTFNFTKLNSTTYLYTENNTKIYLKFNCSQSPKTFFLFPLTNTSFSVEPNSQIKISFLITPRKFGNYTITSWGVFSIPQKALKLDSPYIYNYTIKFPGLATGTYYQTFEISNSYQYAYLTFTFKNKVNPKPKLFVFNCPRAIVLGKAYSVSVYGDKIDDAKISFYNTNNQVRTFSLQNSSKYYYSTTFTLTKPVNKVVLIINNRWASYKRTYPVSTKKLSFPSKTILLPAISTNETAKVILTKFNTSVPIPISISTTKVGNFTNYDFYITNEVGANNPHVAKILYLYLSPHQPQAGRLLVNISSPVISKAFSINVEFQGSSETYPERVNITYYNHLTSCVLKGDNIYNSKYYCYFTLPRQINPQSLQSYEFQALKTSYETKIKTLNDKISTLHLYVYIFAIVLIIIAIFYIYQKYKIYILTWLSARWSHG